MTITDVLKKTAFIFTAAAERITGMGRPLWNIFSFSPADDRIAPKQCVSILLDRGGVFVAHGSRFLSRIKIRAVRHYPCEEGKFPRPDEVASNVALSISAFKAGRAEVLLIIPKVWAIVKTVDFPIAVKENLSNVVTYELDRLTPLYPERAFYDFRILAEDETHLKIMLAAVKADILQPYLDALREKGINTSRVIVSLSAFGTLSHYVKGGASAVFVEIHARRYEGGLIRNGAWEAPFAGDFTSGDEQEKVRTLACEINSLVNMLKHEGRTPEVFVSHSPAGKWPAIFAEMIDAPVRFFGGADLPLPFLQKEETERIPYATFGGVLESLWPGAKGMNLLDKGIHKSPPTPLAATIVLLAVLAALGVFRMVSPLQMEYKKAEVIDGEIAARRDEVRKIEALKKDMQGLENEIATIESFKASRPMVLDLLKEMTQALPKNVWLSRLRFAASTAEIEGFAASAAEIVPRLESSRHFRKVEFTSSTFRDIKMNMDRFSVKMEISVLPEEKTK